MIRELGRPVFIALWSTSLSRGTAKTLSLLSRNLVRKISNEIEDTDNELWPDLKNTIIEDVYEPQ